MQPHAPPRRKSSVGIIFAVLLVVGFFFMCVVVLAAVGAMVFARAETSRAHAVAQHERALRHVEQARMEVESHRNAAHAHERLQRTFPPPQVVRETPAANRTMQPIQVARREITIQLDDQGKLKMDNKPVEGKQLKNLLRNAGKGRESAIAITIKADKKCQFEHVATVLSVCQELDFPNVKITTAEP
jgi:biopolymer transport protein ExbD